MSESDDLDAIRAQKREALRDRVAGERHHAPAADAESPSPTEPVHVESRPEFDRIVADHRVVIADFYADWCGPCQLLEPTVRELARDTDAAVAKVDVDALPALAQELRVQGVPTLFVYVDGEPVERLVGVQDYGTLSSLVEQHA